MFPSFRTCTAAGQLLSQTGDSGDQLKLELNPQGNLALTLTTASGPQTKEVSSVGPLTDGEWHTVAVTVRPGRMTVRLSPQGTEDVWDVEGFDLTASTSQLIVGSGMVGCVREGPGVRFTRNGTATVNSNAVRWGAGDKHEVGAGQTVAWR